MTGIMRVELLIPLTALAPLDCCQLINGESTTCFKFGIKREEMASNYTNIIMEAPLR